MSSLQAFSKKAPTKIAAHFLMSFSIILIQKVFFSQKSQVLNIFTEENHNGLIFMDFLKDYQLFMLLALLIKIIIPQILSVAKERKVSTDLIFSIVRTFIVYTFMYGLLHLLWFLASSEVLIRPHQIQTMGSLRILEEKTLATTSKNEEHISLSIGKIRNRLDIQVDGFILSPDKNTAFSVDGSTLKIFDVRTFHAPVLISSLILTSSSYSDDSYTRQLMFSGLLQSNDGKTLYYIRENLIEIIDVSNYEVPVLITAFQFRSTAGKSWSFPVAISHDENFLFLTNEGLNIYDVSDQKNPKLVETGKLNGKEISSLAVGSDDILYVTDGTLRAYDISDIQNIKLIESYPPEDSSTNRIHLSKDKKMLFLLSSKSYGDVYNITLHLFNVSNPRSLQVIGSHPFDETSSDPPEILTLSPDESQIFIKIYHKTEKNDFIRKVVAFNLKKKLFWSSENSLLISAETMIFQSSQNLFAILNDQAKPRIAMIELYNNFPNRGISSLANNVIARFYHETILDKLLLSSNNKLILGPLSSQQPRLEMWDVSNVSAPSRDRFFYTNRSSVSTNGFFKILVGSHSNKLFTMDRQSFYIYNLSDFSSKSYFPLLGSDASNSFDENSDNEEFLPLIWKVTTDANYVFILQKGKTSRRLKLQIKNISDLSNTTTTASIYFPASASFTSHLFFTKDQNILFMKSPFQNASISIFNVSDRSIVQFISSFPIKGESDVNSFISHDDKTLFLETRTKNGYQLEIYNITNLTAPQLLSTFPLSSYTVSTEEGLSLSSDSKTIYHAQLKRILVIDVSDLKAPVISGIIGIPDSSRPSSIVLSPNQEVAFLQFRMEECVNIIDLVMKYTLFFKREKFLLGEKYKETLTLLNFNKSLQMYDPMQSKSYKFIRSFMLTLTSDEKEPYSFSTTDSLPYWMDFDKENSVLSIEPQRENLVGNYTFCSGLSTQIPQDVFVKYGLFKNLSASEDLMKTLMTMGYIDNRYFSTSRLTSLDEFTIPGQDLDNRTLIFNIIKSYYFEPCTKFELIPSLEVSFVNMKKISIQTPNSNSIKLDIKLGKNQTHMPGQFLLQSYKDLQSKVLENSSRLILEGSLKEIDFALEKLVVNIQENKTSCDGKIMVTDYLNPQVTHEVDNLCDYFMPNQPPEQDKIMTIQSQIDAQTLSTGHAFVILLHEKTFTDRFPGQLTYELVYLNKGKRMAIPSWMSFNNLFFSGVPPEDIFKRDFEFALIAKNEFKQVEVPFSLHINISSWFALKLAARYSPYVLTVIGLVIYFNKIYNILAKRRYKHPKEFCVQPGQEITSNVIYPVIFISEEKKESEKIFKALQKLISVELGAKSVPLSQLASYFANQDSLDKARLIAKIKEALDIISAEEENAPRNSSVAATFIQQTINQIIINKMTMIFLSNLPKGNITKKTFEDIKGCWTDLVDWDESIGLVINETRYLQLLKSNGINQSFDVAKTAQNSMIENSIPNEENLQIPLVVNKDEPEINISLLKDGLLAYAFNCHHVDLLAENVQINMKRRVKGNFVTRFFKLNLKIIQYSQKYKAGYGLKHKIKNDVLRFSGIIDEKFYQKTLVIQIASAKEKILREIWVHGGVKNEANEKNNMKEIGNKNYDIL